MVVQRAKYSNYIGSTALHSLYGTALQAMERGIGFNDQRTLVVDAVADTANDPLSQSNMYGSVP